jgi:hypothetical protein
MQDINEALASRIQVLQLETQALHRQALLRRGSGSVLEETENAENSEDVSSMSRVPRSLDVEDERKERD